LSRLSRDDVFLQWAEWIAQRGTCLRAQVGAVIVKEGRPISTGYNGAPPGLPHCLEVGCEEPTAVAPDGTRFPTVGCQRAVHAELNAVAWAARNGVSTEGATMYCTHAPCKTCAEAMLSAGIARLVYARAYREERLDLLENIEVEHHVEK
jgi:dCMP deaminase